MMFCASVILLLALSPFLAKCADEEETPVRVFDQGTFDSELPKNPHFIKFYAPWCGHCKALAPTWDLLAQKYNVDLKHELVTIESFLEDTTNQLWHYVDCTVHRELCSAQGVTGYPTLKFYKPEKETDEAVRYNGKRDIDTLTKFIQDQVNEPEPDKQDAAEVVIDEPVEGLYTLKEASFDQHIEKGNHFIKFYAPWCGHCKKLAPVWADLAKGLLHNDDVTIAKVDCTEHRDVCSENGVKGYPTLLWFSGGKMVQKYASGRTLESLQEFVSEKLEETDSKAEGTEGKVPEAKKTEEAVVDEPIDGLYTLKEASFDQHIEKGNHFIKFYAPWCGHCKKLAPVWADLAKGLVDNDGVTIAKVDCTEHRDVCSEHGVKGYPTLLWFSGGKMVEKYASGRTLESLQEFVSKKLEETNSKVEGTEGKVPEGKKTEIKSEGSLLIGTDDNFDDIIAEGTTFVKFFAPWCGHCKQLAPTWKELSDAYAANPRIKIAKVDCTEHSEVCQKHEVSGYPTLLVFVNGEKKAEHEGGRNLESLQNFLTEHHGHDEL